MWLEDLCEATRARPSGTEEPAWMSTTRPRWSALMAEFATSSQGARVAVVDEDSSTRQMLTEYLTDYGLQVATTSNAEGLSHLLREHAFDLILLDLRLPDEDGLLLACALRRRSYVPIIVLTSRLDEADRVMSLELGADDFLTKPFSPRELLARIRALLRRSRMQPTPSDGQTQVRTYRFAQWELNVPLRKLVTPAGEMLPVSVGAFNLLVVFLSSPRRTLSRGHLLDHSHVRNDEVFDRAVDVQVRRLRKILEPDPTHPRLILTRRGEGYLFNAAVDVVRQ